MFINYHYGYFLTIYPYLSTSIILDECNYYRYISHFINNVIITDKAIIIAIYRHIKFTDDIEKALDGLSGTSTAYLKPNRNQRNQSNVKTIPGISNWFEWSWPVEGSLAG